MNDTPDQRTRRILREQGFPEGLIPNGVTAADIHDDGRFSVTLPRRVERKHGGYRVRFGPRIQGQLSEGKVTRLKGVEAKQMLWFPVQAITVDGDVLVFSVGPTKHRLPRSEFPWP